MTQRLRRGQMCPLHHSYFCCGRKTAFTKKQAVRKARARKPDVDKVQDDHHLRGYREVCSARELTRRKMILLTSGLRTCFYCKGEFDDYRQIELAHIEPKGMGGARHDDHMANLTLAHRACNTQNGSRRPAYATN